MARSTKTRIPKADWVCVRCSAPLREETEINALTGRTLLRDGAPVVALVCSASCGYRYRPKPARRPAKKTAG
jgi:hypothetical protein